MEVGYEGSPSPVDHYMLDVGKLHLKQARSPPRSAQPPSIHGPEVQGLVQVSMGSLAWALAISHLGVLLARKMWWWRLYR